MSVRLGPGGKEELGNPRPQRRLRHPYHRVEHEKTLKTASRSSVPFGPSVRVLGGI